MYICKYANAIPWIEDIEGSCNVFSTIDFRSAYRQILILDNDRHYTEFEICGQLYQFKIIPFGVTNRVAVFQRVIIIKTEGLKDHCLSWSVEKLTNMILISN